MSPEQALGEPVDPRTDLFSLGCVLYVLLTGAVPFEGATLSAVLKKLTSAEPVPLLERTPQTPTRLADFVQRLMAKTPAERPASAAEVAATLTAIEKECDRSGNRLDSPPDQGRGLFGRMKQAVLARLREKSGTARS